MEAEENKVKVNTLLQFNQYLPPETDNVKMTLIASGTAGYGRDAFIEIIDDKVIFDDSDGEYGPMYFDLQLLKDKIAEHER